MHISSLAFVAFLSSSPSAVESASIRGLMNRRSSRTTTTTIDKVVHSDLDPQAIALAETTDVHPHLAAADNPKQEQQNERKLNVDGSGSFVGNCWVPEGKDPPAEAWHPTYLVGWTNGYCQFNLDCNSPSYSSELACCKGACSGQRGSNCLNSLPNPPTGSPTDLGEGVYYPDYATLWSEATCKNDLPWSFGPNDRPTYTNMKDCCDNAYAGQVSGACLTAYYASFPEPPTGSPTEFGEGEYFPDYETDWVDATCLNTKPFPFSTGSRPIYNSMLSCCQSAYAGQVSGACMNAYYASFPNPPTGSPTDMGEGQYYPHYESKWEVGYCTNTKPYPFTTGSRPMYTSQLACCKGAYAGQTSEYCLTQLPDGLRPTSFPTGPGGSWYNNENSGDAAVRVCTNETPKPKWGVSESYDSKLECCDKALPWQFSKACYCWATKCAEGTDVCEDGDDVTMDASEIATIPPSLFKANVGCESCSGDLACMGAMGNIGYVGNPGCKSCGSCVGVQACTNFGYDIGGAPPFVSKGGSIGSSSCVGRDSCFRAYGSIGDGSCLGQESCFFQTGTIGDQSCTKGFSSAGSDVAVCTPEGEVCVTEGAENTNAGCSGSEGTIAIGECVSGIYSTYAGGPYDWSLGLGRADLDLFRFTVVDYTIVSARLEADFPAGTSLFAEDPTDGCATDASIVLDGNRDPLSTATDVTITAALEPGDYILSVIVSANNQVLECGVNPGTYTLTLAGIGGASCHNNVGKIGDRSCTEHSSCTQSGIIGNDSCNGVAACAGNNGEIRSNSCNGKVACRLSPSFIDGNGQTVDPTGNTGKIGQDSCNADSACNNGNDKDIGNGSCNKMNACNDLKVNVGNNSCNRSAGCNACTAGTDVGDNMCNGGANDMCPETCG